MGGKKKINISAAGGRKRRLFICGFRVFVAVWPLAVEVEVEAEAEARSFVLPCAQSRRRPVRPSYC